MRSHLNIGNQSITVFPECLYINISKKRTGSLPGILPSKLLKINPYWPIELSAINIRDEYLYNTWPVLLDLDNNYE